ncbi:MAG: hypothetical protein HGB08_00835 [Candidatus Moranbacteria bacterium]|nr:hypothetical protein [Candidatus Moranbacteria bacterium]
MRKMLMPLFAAMAVMLLLCSMAIAAPPQVAGGAGAMAVHATPQLGGGGSNALQPDYKTLACIDCRSDSLGGIYKGETTLTMAEPFGTHTKPLTTAKLYDTDKLAASAQQGVPAAIARTVTTFDTARPPFLGASKHDPGVAEVAPLKMPGRVASVIVPGLHHQQPQALAVTTIEVAHCDILPQSAPMSIVGFNGSADGHFVT